MPSEVKNKQQPIPSEVKELLAFGKIVKWALAENRYVAQSEYKKMVDDFVEVQKHFSIFAMEEYCRNTAISTRSILISLFAFETLEKTAEIVNKHNAEYIKKAKIDEEILLGQYIM